MRTNLSQYKQDVFFVLTYFWKELPIYSFVYLRGLRHRNKLLESDLFFLIESILFLNSKQIYKSTRLILFQWSCVNFVARMLWNRLSSKPTITVNPHKKEHIQWSTQVIWIMFSLIWNDNVPPLDIFLPKHKWEFDNTWSNLHDCVIYYNYQNAFFLQRNQHKLFC